MIIKVFNTGVLQVNTYLLIDEESKEAAIIDLGGDFDTVSDEIIANDAKLKFVLNTHGHFDHIMGDLSVKNSENPVPIYMHKGDIWHAENIEASLQRWGIASSHPPIVIDEFVDENTKLSLGKIPIKVIHTPGHSQGGVCYLIEDNLFAGDTLFQGSIGRTDLDGGDYQTLIESIKTKLLPLGDDIKIFPGHGPSSTIGYERKYNSFLV